jgi:beta-aspartyl-peptidase (threonine type)
MKILLAKTTLDFLSQGEDSPTACSKGINLLAKRVDGRGGIICIDRNGKAGYDYNTPYMARALADENGVTHVGIDDEQKKA